MLFGLFMAICTGLCWVCIGIVLSTCASKKLSIVSISLLHTLLSCLVTCFLVDFQKITASEVLVMMGFVLLAGCLNASGGSSTAFSPCFFTGFTDSLGETVQ